MAEVIADEKDAIGSAQIIPFTPKKSGKVSASGINKITFRNKAMMREESPGMCPIKMRSTTLYKMFIKKATMEGMASFTINFPSGAEPSSNLFFIFISFYDFIFAW